MKVFIQQIVYIWLSISFLNSGYCLYRDDIEPEEVRYQIEKEREGEGFERKEEEEKATVNETIKQRQHSFNNNGKKEGNRDNPKNFKIKKFFIWIGVWVISLMSYFIFSYKEQRKEKNKGNT